MVTGDLHFPIFFQPSFQNKGNRRNKRIIAKEFVVPKVSCSECNQIINNITSRTASGRVAFGLCYVEGSSTTVCLQQSLWERLNFKALWCFFLSLNYISP